MNTHQTTADGLQILYQRYYANNPERQLELEKARIDDEVARKISSHASGGNLATRGQWHPGIGGFFSARMDEMRL